MANLVSQLIVSLVDRVSGPAKAVAKSIGEIDKSAKNLGKGGLSGWGWGTAFDKEIERLKLTGRQVQKLRDEYRGMMDTLSRVKGIKPADMGFARQTWIDQTLPKLRAMRREASEFARVMAHAGRMAAGAAGIYGAQHVAREGARRTVRAGAIATREDARDYMAGLRPEETARLRAGSLALSARYKSLSASDAHERLRDTAMSMRSIDKAMELADTIGAGHTVLQSLKGKDAALNEGRKFFKALDTLGKNIDPAEVRELYDGYIKALGVEGADLNLGDLFTAVKRAKSAGPGMSNRFLMAIAPGLMQDMGADRFGTAMGSAIAQIDRATKTSKQEQQRWGLRDAKGQFIDREAYARDPDVYASKYLLPALRKHGIDPDDPAGVAGALSKLFSNQLVSDLFTKLITQREQYAGKSEQYGRAPGLAAAEQLPTKDPFVAVEGLLAQLNNLASTLAGPAIEAAIPRINELASAIARLTQSAEKKPVQGLLGAGLLAGGAVLGAAEIGKGYIQGGAKGAAGAAGGLLRMFPWLAAALGLATTGDILTKPPHGYQSWEDVYKALGIEIRKPPAAAPDPQDVVPDPQAFGNVGKQSVDAYASQLLAGLEKLKADVQSKVSDILRQLNINASPTITPNVKPMFAPAAPSSASPMRAAARGLHSDYAIGDIG